MATEINLKRNGEVEVLQDLSVFRRRLALILRATVIGGGIPTIFLITKIFHEGFSGFLRLMIGWWHYAVFSQLLGIRTGADASAAWQAAWDGSVKTRMLILLVWIFASALSAAGAYFIIRWRGRSRAEGQGLREGEYKLMTPRETQKEIDKTVRDPSNNHEYTIHDLKFSDNSLRVTKKSLSKSIGYAGGAGSGKTNAINQTLEQIRAAKDKTFIIDPDGAYYARFGQPGDIILSLMDARTAKWDPWAEGLDENKLAAGLVEFRENMEAREAFFQGNGLTLLAGLFRQTNSLPELWQLCMRSLDEVREFLHDRGDAAKSVLGKGGKDQDSAIFNIAVQKLRTFLPFLNHYPQERETASGCIEEAFSIRKWVKDDSDRRWVFLVATDGDWQVTKPVFQLQTYIATSAMYERPTNSDVVVYIKIDEVSTVGYIQTVPLMLDKVRKYNGVLAMGFQTFAQLEDIYGATVAKNIMGGLQNMFVFNIKDEELAKRYSGFFTSREVELGKTSENLSDRGGPSVSKEIADRRLVSPSQFQTLPERTAFVRLADFPPTKLYWSHKNYPDINELSNVHSKKPERPWLGSMPVTRYRSVRDQERELFLNDMKVAADTFIAAFQDVKDPDRIARLGAAVDLCKKVLAGGTSIRETIDGEVYEISYCEPQIAVIRQTTKVQVALGEAETEEEDAVAEETPEESDPIEFDDGFS